MTYPKLISADAIAYPQTLIDLCAGQPFKMLKIDNQDSLLKNSNFDMSMQERLIPQPTEEIIDGVAVTPVQDACQVLYFSYDEKTKCGTVLAMLSLIKVASHITMRGVVTDIKRHQVLGRYPITSERYNEAYCELNSKFQLNDTDTVAAEDIATLIEAEWEEDGSTHFIVVEHENKGGGLDPEYTHIWPKKEDKTVEISIVDSAGGQGKVFEAVTGEQTNKGDQTDNIVIAFNSTIYHTYDIDYLCKVSRSLKGKPYFTTPGKGIISVPDASPVMGDQVTGKCVVTQLSGEGAAMREYSIDYSPGVFSKVGNDLHYNMYMSWKQEYLGPPAPTDINAKHLYYLLIEAPFETVGGRVFTVRVIISSKEIEPAPGTLGFQIPILLFTYDCLAADTQIAMSDGQTRVVQEICQGDMVLLADGGTARVRSVRGDMANRDMVELTCGARKLLTTHNHPVLTREGMKPAGTLKTGDVVCVAADAWQPLDAVQATDYTGMVYNLELESGEGIFASGIAVG